MLAIIVHFEIKPGTEADAIETLRANATGSRTERGCLKWEWSRHADEPHRFAIYELYVDRAAIDFHKASAHFKEWQTRTTSFLKSKTSAIYEVDGVDPRPMK